MPFLRAATRNLSPEPSAQSKDFNLKRVLFCRGNHGRLFQQNRTKPALRGFQGSNPTDNQNQNQNQNQSYLSDLNDAHVIAPTEATPITALSFLNEAV